MPEDQRKRRRKKKRTHSQGIEQALQSCTTTFSSHQVKLLLAGRKDGTDQVWLLRMIPEASYLSETSQHHQETRAGLMKDPGKPNQKLCPKAPSTLQICTENQNNGYGGSPLSANI